MLHASEQLLIDDRAVFAGMDLIAVNDLAEVNSVAQQVEQGPATEWLAALGLAATALPLLFIAGSTRVALAKTAGPLEAAACSPQDGPKGCTTGKGAAGGCPHCAAASKGRD